MINKVSIYVCNKTALINIYNGLNITKISYELNSLKICYSYIQLGRFIPIYINLVV